MLNFNRTNAIVKFLRDNPGKKFTGHEIAAWLGNTYPEEIIRKEQMSKNKILLGITDKAIRKKFVIKLIQNEFNSNFRTALQKKEPKIKITDEYQPKYYYIDKIANYGSTIHKEFDLKSIVIKFLRDNLNKEFTNSQIATSIINMYPEEAEQKAQASNDKRLLNATSKLQRTKIITMIYRNELNRLSSAIQKIEPKIQLIKKGGRFKYCYVNNYDKIVNNDNNNFNLEFNIIKFLKDNVGKEFASFQITAWLVNTYTEESEQKLQISDYKLSKEEIAILLHKEVDSLCMTIQKIEPKIKIIENGCWTKYCYIDNTDKIFDKFKVIKTLESHKQQEFTAIEMAQLLLGTNSR